MSDDPTNLVQRVALAKAALVDMGRPDLADDIRPADSASVRFSQAITWRVRADHEPEDKVLLFKAAAVASLASGYDEPGLPCENHVRNYAERECQDRVTRSEFVFRIKMCKDVEL